MKILSAKNNIIKSKYSHLNEEEKGIISRLIVVNLMMLIILLFWTTGCWYLGISEMVYLDGIGSIGFLVLFLAISLFGISFHWSRLILFSLCVLVTCTPVMYYGLDSLFTLHLVIIPMSGIMFFTKSEKRVFYKCLFAFLIVLICIVLYDFHYGALYQLEPDDNLIINILIASGSMGVSFYYALYFYEENNNYKNLIQLEREKSDRLLHSIFPKAIAERLRESNESVAESFDNVAVVFVDIVGFTNLSSSMSPDKLVELLDEIFSAFDKVVDQYAIEKIKTIGDAYMAVCGIPIPNEKSSQNAADMALKLIQIVNSKFTDKYNLKVRIGIHTGRVVAGVIGNKKFSYDLWGDTVNIASRFESSGAPNKIHITEAVKNSLDNAYLFEDRGEIMIKGKGSMKSFYLMSKH